MTLKGSMVKLTQNTLSGQRYMYLANLLQ